MNKKELIKRYILLVIGVYFIGLGVAFAKHSDLGISPISSIGNIMSIKFPFLTVGTWITLWNCTMVLMQIIILRKDFKLIQFLQFPISFIMGIFTDFNMLFISYIPTDLYFVRIILILLGTTTLGFGITLTLISDTAMNVGEAFVNVIATKLNKNFANVKIFFDISCVALSTLLSLIFFDFKIVGNREGTLIIACCTGFIVKFFSKKLKDPITSKLKSL